MKGEGKDNDLLERIAADPAFGLSRQEVFRHLDPAAYIGCCPQQVERFLDQQVPAGAGPLSRRPPGHRGGDHRVMPGAVPRGNVR